MKKKYRKGDYVFRRFMDTYRKTDASSPSEFFPATEQLEIFTNQNRLNLSLRNIALNETVIVATFEVIDDGVVIL